MIKINPYYRTDEDLNKAEEPFMSITRILERLYLDGVNGKKNVSYYFKNTYAVSCMRDFAEDLAKKQTTFVSRLNSLWGALMHPNNQFSNSFDSYGVPYERYQGIIFGGVYYVLAMQKSVSVEHLDLLNSFVSAKAEALPYFNVYKEAVKPNVSAIQPQDMGTLRNQFIQNLNNNPEIINKVDWADVTIAFDKDVMTEIFWGIENDKILKSVCSAIIGTWDKLYEKKDLRCREKNSKGFMPNAIDPWKFGGAFKESINDFFNNLWVERNAKNAYSSYKDGSSMQKRFTNPVTQTTQEENVVLQSIQQPDRSMELEEALATIESLKNDLEAFKVREKDGRETVMFSAKQMAIIIKAILLNHKSLTNNVKNLAPLLQYFGGWKEKYATSALGYAVTQRECDKLEEIFKPFAPAIGSIIKQYPTVFAEEKKVKLENNLGKNG